MKREIGNLIQISAEEILSTILIPADIYMKLGPTNFVLIAREGALDQKEQIHMDLKIKQGANFFVHKDHYHKFLEQSLNETKDIFNARRSTLEDKINALSKITSNLFSTLTTVGFDSELFESARTVTLNVIKTVDQHSNLKKLFESLDGVSNDLVRHSLSVAMISVMIAQNRGWINQDVFEKIAMGALLHDVGMKEYPKEFLSKPRSAYTAEEVRDFERHCYRGVEILQNVPNVPIEVIAIIYEHHENAIGQGYPRALRDVHIHPYAKIVALADTFCELTEQTPANPHPRKPHEALDYIEHTLGQPYNKEAFVSLKSILMYGLKRPIVKYVA